MAYGYRAVFVILRVYINRYHLDTIEKIIRRWAPPSENNTLGYIETVEEKSGTRRDKKLKVDKELIPVVAAMSYVENGMPADIEVVEMGYKML